MAGSSSLSTIPYGVLFQGLEGIMEKEGATEGFYVVAKADFGRQKQEETLEMSLCRGFLLSVGCQSTPVPLPSFLEDEGSQSWQHHWHMIPCGKHRSPGVWPALSETLQLLLQTSPGAFETFDCHLWVKAVSRFEPVLQMPDFLKL